MKEITNARGKASAEDVEHIDDVALKDAETTILHHYQYNRVDDIASHIDAAIDQLNAIEETNRYRSGRRMNTGRRS